ncbi:hypothetical protein CSV79_11530 [Sporosarcina sp. P13]|uniref:carboxypeptidase regulatory-like domain-containing protein n=1 Tax=Sporosarcina sp. P13 TaxID=2048263 RepID=UPI000C162FBA|nr:carboxypeptidase regulatory-like domain-containing protein [Sporosarcina sp. P13]PIC63503.1 hypothetical protein CSV79_11530 [Sporosarcina sp. P13]
MNKATQPGTYGPATGTQVIAGDFTVSSPGVNLQNMVIEGNLILGPAVGEGDVHLNGVTVQGTTIINGGGENSIYFTDSVLATVIVNKNNGAVRIVAQGSTQVFEVQLETPARVVEQGLTGNAPGFTDIVVSEAMQTSQYGVQLEGVFETINSRATNVRITLEAGTDIRTLVLNALATVLGTGNIQLAEINADGSTLSQRPQNVVLNNGQVTIAGDVVDSSYSDNSATAVLNSIAVSPGSISLNTTQFIAGLTASDFNITAKVDNEAIELNNVSYDSNQNRFTFNPIALIGNEGKQVEIAVTPAVGSKVTGTVKTASYLISTGFGGRITDVQEVGMANATLTFKANNQVVGTATTDRHGYYSVNLPAGTYQGEISGPGYITSQIFGVAATDVFLMDQNETGIRAGASNEVKIMLDWGEYPSDLDSHLTGPGADGNRFHVWYANKQATTGETTYVDLDWDDTDSYGPETTTIRKLVDGEYRFYIHNYSSRYDNENTLSGSKAKVKVFKGNANTPDLTFNVPEGDEEAIYWIVFDMKVSNNGETIDIVEVNTMTKEEPIK